ncbi:hypothetical protein A6V39_00845 [Candidatus Mycoplasma haematobovis]|uniref:Uncharacterized protein n=1 Tax=Candidatus Mycoplasma haematobovis TaxID=432608 RepID=A0A1A9QFV6_9MOLU|nr:hypothetical protein [Candidatus Mycoplasma haematobovis]OAL10599.1 hypothetical protein A6V39_00845 [Candidatus Mycoplasma haematobovis]
MASLKTVAIGIGLATGVAGVAGIVAHSKGLFNSNTQISELLEQENKYALLPANSGEYEAEWDAAWKRYADNSNNTPSKKDKWNIPAEEGLSAEKASQTFKNVCQQKATEKVKARTDQKYIDITNYCSRPKKLSEVLNKEGIELLATTGKEVEWKAKFNSYKTSNNQIPGATSASATDEEQHFTKLREGCKVASDIKTTDNNYSKTYAAVKEWCKV